MRRHLLLVVLGALVAAGAVVAGVLSASRTRASPEAQPPAAAYRGSEPPPGIRIVDATLRSYRGNAVNLRAQEGKVVVLTFLDSKCSDTCPIIAAVIGRMWPLLTPAEKARVRVYAISVNPLVDTPSSVQRFLAARRAAAAIDWLVGPVRRMRPVWHAFGVLPATETGNNDLHSADVRVFDRRGTWMSTQHAGVDLSPANLAHDIRLALKAGA